jgi:hypothetical protein
MYFKEADLNTKNWIDWAQDSVLRISCACDIETRGAICHGVN